MVSSVFQSLYLDPTRVCDKTGKPGIQISAENSVGAPGRVAVHAPVKVPQISYVRIGCGTCICGTRRVLERHHATAARVPSNIEVAERDSILHAVVGLLCYQFDMPS